MHPQHRSRLAQGLTRCRDTGAQDRARSSLLLLEEEHVEEHGGADHARLAGGVDARGKVDLEAVRVGEDLRALVAALLARTCLLASKNLLLTKEHGALRDKD